MLVRGNHKITNAVNDISLSELIICAVQTYLCIEKKIFDNATTITYVSVDERKIIDVSSPEEMIWLIGRFVEEHGKFVNYNNPSSLMHVYTYALIKNNDANDGWYDLNYVQIQIETECPIQSKLKPFPSYDIEPFVPNECINDMHGYLYDNIFTISDNATVLRDGEDKLAFVLPSGVEVKYFKNPQHIMAEILAKRLMTLGWLPKDHIHAGDFLHMFKDDEHLLISCTRKNAALFNKDGTFPDISIDEYVAGSGYVFDTKRMFSMSKKLLVSLEEMQELYTNEYITWLYNKHAEDIQAIDEYRKKTGCIEGVAKESAYCYKLWNGRGLTQLIQNPVSLQIVFMRELLTDGYLIKSIDYDHVNLRNKDDTVTIIVNTTTNEPITIIGPISSYEQNIAASLGVKIEYTVIPKFEPLILTELDTKNFLKVAKAELLLFLNEKKCKSIVTTKESTTEFLKLKVMLNALYAAYTGNDCMDTNFKDPSKFFSAAKVKKLLKDCEIPFTIKSTTSKGVRTTIITPIDGDDTPVVDDRLVNIAESVLQQESNHTPAEDESSTSTSDEYNSIL